MNRPCRILIGVCSKPNMAAASLLVMDQSTDTNAAIWKSDEGVQFWTAKTGERQQKRAAQWRFMGELLPFAE